MPRLKMRKWEKKEGEKVRSWEGEKVGELDEHGAKGIAGKENWTKCKKLKWECGSGKSDPSSFDRAGQ
jgi:hypothetical protein